MIYISDIPKNTLSVEIDKRPLIYIPKINQMVARHEFGMVILFVDKKRIELNTITAHKVGLAIAKAKLSPKELIVIKINGERIELLWPVASKLSTALLRKADAADDWQLQRVKK